MKVEVVAVEAVAKKSEFVVGGVYVQRFDNSDVEQHLILGARGDKYVWIDMDGDVDTVECTREEMERQFVTCKVTHLTGVLLKTLKEANPC